MAACLPSTALAQDQSLPAVGNVNGKLSFGYDSAGGDDDADRIFVNGALSFPVSNRLGAQLDLGGTDASSGAGVHLFMRDPSSYLVGVYAHRVQSDTDLGTAQNLRYGLEAEGYFGNLTIAGFIGQDEVYNAGPSKTFDVVELDFDYYLSDNTLMSLSTQGAFEKEAATIGISHLYDAGGTSFAVSTSVGTYDGETTGSFGLTVFFGNDGKSLKEIHRQNDPRVRLGPSPTRSGYFDALKAGEVTNTPTPCSKYCAL
ncbi:hypothetical protein ACS3SW_03590 [Roseobacteraceae bacterium S113]